jgi:hypothetical protein
VSVASVLRRKPWLAGVALVAVVAGIAAYQAGRVSRDEVSETFCYAFEDLELDLGRMERVIRGEGTADDLPLSSYQGVAGLWWSDGVALGGPPRADEDARRIARAVRSALEAESVRPLRTPEVLEARRRLAPVAAEACKDGPR